MSDTKTIEVDQFLPHPPAKVWRRPAGPVRLRQHGSGWRDDVLPRLAEALDAL